MKNLQPYEKIIESLGNLKKELLNGTSEEQRIAYRIDIILFSNYPHKTNKESTMQNYLMIDGVKMEFADDVIEKIKKMFTKDISKDSPEDKCKELNDMVNKYSSYSLNLSIIYKDQCKKEIVVHFPEHDTSRSICIMKGVIEFCIKYPSTTLYFDCRKIMYLSGF